MNSTEELEQQAGRFLIEQDDPAFTDEQRAELCRWMSQSLAHCIAYVNMVREWRWHVVFYVDGHGGAVNRLIGAMLQACREERGLTVEELAKRTNIAASRTKSFAKEIQQFECGEKELTFDAVMALAPALRMSASRLATKLEQALCLGRHTA